MCLYGFGIKLKVIIVSYLKFYLSYKFRKEMVSLISWRAFSFSLYFYFGIKKISHYLAFTYFGCLDTIKTIHEVKEEKLVKENRGLPCVTLYL